MDPTTTTTTSPTVTFLPGKRGALNAVVDGYRYTKNGSHKENVYYRCVEQKTCNTRITLTGGSLSSSLPTHLHPSQEADLAVLQTKSDIKKKASSTDLSTKNIVSTSLGLLDFEGVARLGCQLSSLNRMSQRARRKANRTPPLPTSLEQISIPSSYLTNDHGENMMLWDSGYTVERRRSFMFGSIDSVNVISDCDHLMLDGTFSSSPQLFQQLLTIHGWWDSGWHIPLVYGLLPGKTEVLYTSFLEELDSLAQFEPQSVLCDFERGLHNAVQHVWPGVTVRGCYFHYKQALWRKMQAFDLSAEYKVLSSPVRKMFKAIGALPFVEPGSVVDVWEDQIKPNLPSDMEEFGSYFERTWVGSGSSSPLFDIMLWNQYDAVLAGLPRSNNFVEGWHNGFQTLVGGSNPTLWTFLTALKKEENITFAKKVKKMMGEGPEAKRRKWRLYDERLSSIVTDFEQYDPMDYLSCIGAILFDI
ncbi:hypothetical protein ACHWQZ_G019400 [Mnemiopsis leidyi]